jgi:tryptophan synthase alpha chain
MGRISDRFATLRERGETALIPFVTAGDPDLAMTEALVPALVEAGADLVELGVPFSDPLAEGPTIQRSSERALRSGTSLRRIFELVRKLRAKIDVPIILMGYANVPLTMGVENFASQAADTGVDGTIIVDIPPEEGPELYTALEAAGVDGVLLAAPTTTPERLEMLANKTRGFLYYVSLTGVTGARSSLAEGIEEKVKQAKGYADIPVCVGFGVSTQAHAAEVGAFADGVVVGSALVNRIEAAGSQVAAVDAAAAFIAELKQPLR